MSCMGLETPQPSEMRRSNNLFSCGEILPSMFVSSWMFLIHIVPCCNNHWQQCCEDSLDVNSLNFFHGMKSQTPTDHSFNFLKSWRRVGKTLSATVYLNRTLAWGWDLYMNHFCFLLKNWFDISSWRLWFFADTAKIAQHVGQVVNNVCIWTCKAFKSIWPDTSWWWRWPIHQSERRGICEFVHSREAASEGFLRWRKVASANDLLGLCCCLGSFLISNVLGSSPHFFWFLTHCSYSFLHLLNRTYPHFLQLHLPKKNQYPQALSTSNFRSLPIVNKLFSFPCVKKTHWWF